MTKSPRRAELTDTERQLHDLAKLHYADLLHELELLEASLLDGAELRFAQVFQLPVYSDKDIGTWPETIPIQTATGLQALKLALAHLHNFKLSDTHSGRIIQRLPGIIGLQHPEPQSIRLRMWAINQKKLAFHQALKDKCPNANKRFLLLMAALPNVVKLKAFRDILFANRPLYSVGFTWKHRYFRQRLSKSQLEEMLKKTRDYYLSRCPLSEKGEQVQMELEKISQYPASSQFIQQRQMRITPDMNLRYDKSTDSGLFISSPDARAPVDMIAHSPLFVFNQDVKLHPLQAYQFGRANGPMLPATDLVIPRLHIYVERSA